MCLHINKYFRANSWGKVTWGFKIQLNKQDNVIGIGTKLCTKGIPMESEKSSLYVNLWQDVRESSEELQHPNLKTRLLYEDIDQEYINIDSQSSLQLALGDIPGLCKLIAAYQLHD